MKTAVSIPQDIFDSGERTAADMGLSRSALYARAVAEFVSRHDAERVTELLDAVYAGPASESALDRGLATLQSMSLPADEAW